MRVVEQEVAPRRARRWTALIEEARQHQRRRRRRISFALVVLAVVVVALAVGAGVSYVSTTASSRAVFPTLRSGQACPTTPGQPVHNAFFVGDALGRGPVRMLIANAGDLRRGIVYVSRSDLGNPLGPAGYYAFQNFWYSLPSYQGAWTVTAQRLDGAAHILFGNSDPTPTAQPVPSGTTQGFGPGYRSGVGSTWIDAVGCYGFHVTGPHLSETIIVDVMLH